MRSVRAAVLAMISSKMEDEPAAGRRQKTTTAAEEVVTTAEALAGGAPIGSHHLLEALARAEGSMAARALQALGVDVDELAAKIDELDPEGTTDATPAESAARKMELRLDGDYLRLARNGGRLLPEDGQHRRGEAEANPAADRQRESDGDATVHDDSFGARGEEIPTNRTASTGSAVKCHRKSKPLCTASDANPATAPAHNTGEGAPARPFRTKYSSQPIRPSGVVSQHLPVRVLPCIITTGGLLLPSCGIMYRTYIWLM